MGLNCVLENESQGKDSVFCSPEAASHLWLQRSVSLKVVNSSFSVAGFCWWDQQGLDQPWQCAQLTARSKKIHGSWTGEDKMWVELEMQPVSKCSLLYVSASEDILMKISRNLIWVSSLWTPVLYRVQALKWNHSHGEGMSNPIHINCFPLSPP